MYYVVFLDFYGFCRYNNPSTLRIRLKIMRYILNNPLSKNDSLIIKSIAIIFIVLHNYLHSTNSIGENEMLLRPSRINDLFLHIQEAPIGTFNYLTSYFGWYFITPFIFISGYGLTKKTILNNYKDVEDSTISSIFKIGILMTIGALFIFIMGPNDLQSTMSIYYRKLSTTDNLFYPYVFSGVGPWWYFSLVIQLYIAYPFILKLINKYNPALVMLGSYLLIYIVYYKFKNLSVFATAIGHFPELILGIILAKEMIKPTRLSYLTNSKLQILYLIIILIFFILSNKYVFFFPLTYLSFLLIFLYAFIAIKDKLNNKFFKLIGMISPFIFIINGPIRIYTMEPLTKLKEIYGPSPIHYETILTVMSIMHLLAVCIVAMIIFFISKDVMIILNKKFSECLRSLE